ncbi:DUF4421 domain-containing protein [Prevotella sp. E15-22]|uniref:DUF4421 family protein n=1 Tax=Prevotella sp. E15-22 TaxID=2937774 RepID=UPI00205839A8|nr:DUF4421 family protein [Prevotella sp. E15-22]UPS44447.1 DUF4421 domain-containing protein [Prevotella sp. E15-22]
MIRRTIICLLLFSLNAAAQEQEPFDSTSTQDSKLNWMEQLHEVQQLLETRAKAAVDARYIEVPEKPWRVVLRYKENVVDVDYSQSVDFPGTNDHSDWNLCFEPPVASSVGFWVGYRGTGFSYSKSLTKNAGRYYSLSSTGAKYGFNFRLRRFNTQDAKISSTDYENGQTTQYDSTLNMPAPVWIRSVYINGYYVFNGRRYSQAAAYNQSVIQRRSAGSFLLGATWYQSSFDYSDIRNFVFMILGHGIYRAKVHQANLGVGYGYNWVPLRGLVVNVMAMPTVSLYNRVKAYKYETNYDLSPKESVDNYGDWNKETKTWANGKTHKPILMIDTPNPQFDYWDVEPEVNHSMFRLNLDLRLGIAYNWRNYFVGAQAQYNNFNYKNDHGKINIYDAYARLSFGVRL